MRSQNEARKTNSPLLPPTRSRGRYVVLAMIFRVTTAALLVLSIATINSSNADNVDDRIFGRRLSSNERKRLVITSTKQSNSDNGLSRDATHLRASMLKRQQYHHYNRRRLTEVVDAVEDENENSLTEAKMISSSSTYQQAYNARRNLQYIPGIDPNQDDDLIWDPSYRYPEFEAIIQTELSLSMPLSLSISPTLSPVTSPAPTPCVYRKWYLSYTEKKLSGDVGAKVCINGEYSNSIIGSLTYYDSVDDCCNMNNMSDEDDGEECMKIDVCNPRNEPTR